MSQAASDNTQKTLTRTHISPLQRELRAIYQENSESRALVRALCRIGDFFQCSYLAVHARIGVNFFSEEFCNDGFDPSDQLRDFFNGAMNDALEAQRARCVRLRAEGGTEGDAGPAVIVALLSDDEGESAGAAGILLRDCDRHRAADTLASFESVIGFLSLLISTSRRETISPSKAPAPALPELDPGDPVRLAYHACAGLRHRYGLDEVSIGIVHGHRVDVTAVTGMDDLRASNPGIKALRAAMEEGLDAGHAIIQVGEFLHGEGTVDCDHPLHRSWSRFAGGDSVATVPLKVDDTVVAMLGIRTTDASALTEPVLEAHAAELASFAGLVPLASRAGRTLGQHLADSTSSVCRSVFGTGRKRLFATVAILTLVGSWLAFGTIPYSITVPAVVAPARARTVACPRDGVLVESHVSPGTRVAAGQVLAQLDAREDELRRSELRARLASSRIEMDRLLAEGAPAERRVVEIQMRALRAELAVVEHRIEQAMVRAVEAGVIIEGDLEELVGSQVQMGTQLFRIASGEQVRLDVDIPERSVVLAREFGSAVFVSRARPGERVPLPDLEIPPVAVATPGGAVFRARSTVSPRGQELLPGMEGICHLELAEQNAFWVLTHRITDWLRLNFWM